MEIGSELFSLLTADKTAVRVNIGFGPQGFFDINKSTLLSAGITLFFLALCLFLTSDLRVHHIGKRQAIAETVVCGLRGMLGNLIGEHGKPYLDFVVTLILYIGMCNIIGVFGFEPPTMDLNVTIALAACAIILVETASIRHRGVGGFFKSFAEPVAIMTPMNILELGIRPLSLCMRLFGNILGATVVMELLKAAMPVVLPAIFSLYFDFFDGCIHAYVFCFLTSLYIAEATE